MIINDKTFQPTRKIIGSKMTDRKKAIISASIGIVSGFYLCFIPDNLGYQLLGAAIVAINAAILIQDLMWTRRKRREGEGKTQ